MTVVPTPPHVFRTLTCILVDLAEYNSTNYMYMSTNLLQ